MYDIIHIDFYSYEYHVFIWSLIESDKNLRNLIRIFGITWKSLRESFQNTWNLSESFKNPYQYSESLEFRVKIIHWFTRRNACASIANRGELYQFFSQVKNPAFEHFQQLILKYLCRHKCTVLLNSILFLGALVFNAVLFFIRN